MVPTIVMCTSEWVVMCTLEWVLRFDDTATCPPPTTRFSSSHWEVKFLYLNDLRKIVSIKGNPDSSVLLGQVVFNCGPFVDDP